MTDQITIRQVAKEFDATGFVFCDRGNGNAYGETGQFLPIDNDTLKAYGDIVMHKLSAPMTSDDGFTVEWMSDWIAGENGYEFRVGV